MQLTVSYIYIVGKSRRNVFADADNSEQSYQEYRIGTAKYPIGGSLGHVHR
jgi:hypothetical protein